MQSKLSINHISFRATSEVKRIAMPLFANTPVVFFYYGRNYHDGNALRLHTNNEYFSTWNENLHPWRSSHLKEGVYLWDDIQDSDQVTKRKHNGLGNGITIIKENEQYTEFYAFAPSFDNSLADTFINQKEVFERFILYFLEKADKLISLATEDLLANPMVYYSNDNPKQSICMETIKEMLPIKTIEVPQLGKVQLSKRERSCLKHLLIGRTAREIAEFYELSPKTVETYINRIKQKLKCKTKSQLFQLALSIGIIHPNQSFF